MNIETAILTIYNLRGYADKTADDLNIAFEIECMKDDGAADGYVFTSEGEQEFSEAGWVVQSRLGQAVKMSKGKSDIYLVPLSDTSMGMNATKTLSFLDA